MQVQLRASSNFRNTLFKKKKGPLVLVHSVQCRDSNPQNILIYPKSETECAEEYCKNIEKSGQCLGPYEATVHIVQEKRGRIVDMPV